MKAIAEDPGRGSEIPAAIPRKTVLEEYQLWVGKDREFDGTVVTSIRSPEYNFWGEVKKTRPRCRRFDDGTLGNTCNWYVARVVTDTPRKLLAPGAVFTAKTKLREALESMPKYVSFRGESTRPFD